MRGLLAQWQRLISSFVFSPTSDFQRKDCQRSPGLLERTAGLRSRKTTGTKTIAVARAKLTQSLLLELRALAPTTSHGRAAGKFLSAGFAGLLGRRIPNSLWASKTSAHAPPSLILRSLRYEIWR